MTNPVVVVVGAGRGLGSAVASRFGRAGYDVALIARTEATLTAIGEALQAEDVTAGWTAVDITDEDALRASISRFGEHTGRIDVLHFNPSAFTEKSPLELTPAELLSDVHLGVASLLTAVQAARPFMSDGGRITATGSMSADQPWSRAASLGVQKAALRNLVASVDATLRGDGIRAASVTVRGTIAEGTPFDPALIADAIFEVAQGPDDDWRTEVPFTGPAQGVTGGTP
jgi:NAD(P)-dependent dehydrogenase (short-subunit alcohol dehydrogenase family)